MKMKTRRDLQEDLEPEALLVMRLSAQIMESLLYNLSEGYQATPGTNRIEEALYSWYLQGYMDARKEYENNE